MTQQDDITQRVLTDSEILAIGAMHGRPSVALLPMFRAFEGAVLSKLRSSVAKPWPTEEQPDGTVTPVDPVDMANAPVADEQFKAAFPNGVLTAARFHELWESAGHNPNPDRTLLENLAWQVGKFAGLVAKEASAPVAGKTREAVDYVRGGALNFDAHPDGAPVAGEAVYTLRVRGAIQAWTPTAAAFSIPDGEHQLFLSPAAPQASEAVRTHVLAALESAQRFIRNGIEFGYIRMPDADTPDPAHRTPGLIDAAIRSLKSQADKDGGQQRAGDDCKHARVYRAGDRQGYACPDCGEFVSDYEIHRRQRSALSATQAEQGERDAD